MTLYFDSLHQHIKYVYIKSQEQLSDIYGKNYTVNFILFQEEREQEEREQEKVEKEEDKE